MNAAIFSFETNFEQHRKRSRLTFLVVTCMLVILFLLTAEASNFFKVTQVTQADGTRAERWVIGAGLPRLGEYLAKTIPDLHWATLGSDIAEWFARWRIWARLQVETILIAFMATVLGVIGGFLLSFPAARNLTPAR